VRASSPCHRTFTLAMGSSPGFGSARRDAPPKGRRTPCSDSPSLRVRPSSGPYPAAASNSPAHSSIGTRSAPRRPPRKGGGRVRPLADCGQTVSGTLSLPSPGCFSPFPRGTRALSVARRIEPWTVVGPASRGVSRVPRYSRTRAREGPGDRLRGCHPLRRAVPGASPPLTLADSPRPRQRPPRRPSNPPAA
jgi:hypothetical protein